MYTYYLSIFIFDYITKKVFEVFEIRFLNRKWIQENDLEQITFTFYFLIFSRSEIVINFSKCLAFDLKCFEKGNKCFKKVGTSLFS